MESLQVDFSFKLLCVVIILHLAGGYNLVGGSSIGLCYESEGDNFPSPREVVSMFKSYHIKRIRLYEYDDLILNYLRKSGIEVIIGVKNEDLTDFARYYSKAYYWIKTNIILYWPDVKFKYIAVGNEAIPRHAHSVLKSMRHLHKALAKHALHINVSTVVSTSVIGDNFYLPSTSSFSNDAIEYMTSIARYLNITGTPLLVNVHPYFSCIKDSSHFSLEYATFNDPHVIVADGKFKYRNSFDAIIDALHVSLAKVGAPQVPIVVSETGWPSGNTLIENPTIAQSYLTNIVKHVSSGHGTPRRQGIIETYLYNMFNVIQRHNTFVDKNWGLFDTNKMSVYNISFT